MSRDYSDLRPPTTPPMYLFVANCRLVAHCLVVMNDIVYAAHQVSSTPAVYSRATRSGRTLLVPCRSSGAWFSEQIGSAWWTSFAGTHQRVPFSTSGRTAGRSLRAMRRRLEREQIPAVVCEA